MVERAVGKQEKGDKEAGRCCGRAVNCPTTHTMFSVRRLTHALCWVPESLARIWESARLRGPTGRKPLTLLTPRLEKRDKRTLGGHFVSLESLAGSLCSPSFHITSLSASFSLSCSSASLWPFQSFLPLLVFIWHLRSHLSSSKVIVYSIIGAPPPSGIISSSSSCHSILSSSST